MKPKNPIQRVLSALKREDNILAFGAELSSCKYRLTLARYASMAEFIRRESVIRKKPLKLLDVGCGEGRLILYGPFPEVKFTGIDVRPTSLEMCRERGYAKVTQANLTGALFSEDETYDIVVCSHVLEHLQSPEKMVGEVWRVLKPGGLFVVGVPICVWLTRFLRIHLLPLVAPEKRSELLAARFGHVTFFTLPSLKAVLKDFVIEDVRGFRFLSAGRYLPLENWHWYYRLNAAWGRLCPRMTSEINVVARKGSGIGTGVAQPK
ncbi:MAG: methyltransferase domain-containing protein [Acidobacteria bacterium]|nr:methyltransferase domain-containing protein [Acidobacteriota bacterium]